MKNTTELEALADAVMMQVKQAVEQALVQRDARITTVEADIRELKQRPELKACGGWVADRSYQPGNLVQRQSALWLCTEPTNGSAAPGTAEGSGSWRLVLKGIER